ncbi:YeeE/YedE family protein [Ahrensia sp. R2A130]|uniref:YeeE/YedE family protein n=1 Tax=Ahrensia sp. R2A130 TaxID=744979 RepID=UPI001FFE76DA|nr:YeeE/YedE family protein [Ahrensia sp. R2A130]
MAWPFGGPRYGVAVAIGALAGFALYHAAFGFTGAWRRVVSEKRGQGLRAQMVLLIAACAFTYPLIAYGAPIDGLRSGAWVLPFGVTALVGSFLFGAGMQLGGGCGSGTLFTVGGGSTRMVVTLSAFITGSLIGTWHLPAWRGLPRLEAFSVVKEFGPWAAVAIVAVLGIAIIVWSVRRERAAHGELEPRRQGGSVFGGPWSHTLGVIALVVVSVATILTLGRPWGITSGFALWGAKIASGIGIDVTSWSYWSGGRSRALERSVFADATSVMNFAIIFGAMAAAALAGKWSPVMRIGWRDLATAVIGGLLMGYGARLAYGCNIGAYLGGIVSGSMHGVLWGIVAFTGSSMMVKARMRFGF